MISKFVNLIVAIALLFSIVGGGSVEAKQLTSETIANIRMTGGVTFINGSWKGVGDAKFVLPPNKVPPTTMTVVKTDGRVLTVRPWWYKVNGQWVMHMNLIDNGQFYYFNNMTYRVIPQGISKRVWEESSSKNAICTKRADQKPCDW